MTEISNRPFAGPDDIAVMQAAHARWIAEGADSDMHVGDIPHRLYNGLCGRYYLDDVVRVWKQADKIIAKNGTHDE